MKRLILAALFLVLCCPLSVYSQEISWLPLPGPWGGPVYGLSKDSAGNLYTGSSTGLYRRTQKEALWKNISLRISPAHIVSFEVSTSGHLFIIARSQRFGANRMLFRSIDQGDSWQRLDSGIFENAEFISLKAGPEGKVWATSKTTIYYSSDNGLSWQIRCSDCIYAPSIKLLSSKGHLFTSATFEGISRSTDFGETWETFNEGLPEIRNFFGVNDLIELDSGNFLAATSAGIYRSSDNGETWTHSIEGLPENSYDTATQAIIQIPGGQILASLAFEAPGLYQSFDDGESWTLLSSELYDSGELPKITSFFMPDDQTLFASTLHGVLRSLDLGHTWTLLTEGILSANISALVIGNDDMIFAGLASDGLFRSSDYGETWERLNTEFSEGAVSHLGYHVSGILFAVFEGQGLFKSNDQGETWISINNDIDPNVDQLAINSFSLSNDVILIGSPTTSSMYISLDLGGTWMTAPEGLRPESDILSLPSGHLVGAGGGGLVRSEDSGLSWVRGNSGIGLSEVVAASVDDAGIVYAATYKKGVYWSSDNGGLWNSTDFPSTFIHSMTVAPEGLLFVSTQDSIFVSQNLGESWAPMTSEYRQQKMVHTALDSRGILYAGGAGTGIIRTNTSVLPSTVLSTTSFPSYEIVLQPNFPDPFRDKTNIQYELTRPGRVKLEVYNLQGQQIITLEDTYKLAGKHQISFDASGLPSGMYFYRLTTESNQFVQSMIVLKQ